MHVSFYARAGLAVTFGVIGASPAFAYDINDIIAPVVISASYLSAETKFSYSRGATGKKVRELQLALIRGGYLEVGSDSVTFDERTEKAIKRLQCDKFDLCNGSADTTGYGVVGPKTAKIIAAIKIPKAPEVSVSPVPLREASVAEPAFWGSFATDLAVGAESPDVRVLQKFLNTLGFVIASSGPGSPGFESEYYGRATASAVARFRDAIGEKALGVAGAFDTAIRERVNMLLESLGGFLNLK